MVTGRRAARARLADPGGHLQLGFPNFDRNHNTGADYWSDIELRTAHQAVYSDAQRPAYLTLPVCTDG
jgi:predicted acyl esterase